MSNQQRVIKFRAWDKVNGNMVYEGWAIKFKPEREKVSGIMLEHDQTPNCERIYGEWNDTDSIIVMQFTGLHDKNGKEIWEGDVVGHYDHEIGVVKSEVIYEEGQWKLKSVYDIILIFETEDGKLESLGNVYENKELLNV